MDRVDRLIEKIKNRNPFTDLYIHNPYMGKTFGELLDMMSPEADPGVPENGTHEKDQFSAALLEAAAKYYNNTYELIETSENNEPPTAKEKEPDNNANDPMAAYNRLSGSDPNYEPGYLR